MDIQYIGDGEPDIAIIGTVHGNEPCGEDALRELRKSASELNGCILTICVNERAAEKNERFIDQDLNRVYPGDLSSKNHEERLAAIVYHLTKDIPVYDLHSTKIPTPSGKPFGIFAEKKDNVINRVKNTGVNKTLYFEFDDGSGLHHLESVEVEHMPKGSEEALKQARSTVDQILAAHNLNDNEENQTEPMIYRVYDSVEKDGDYDITCSNWNKVEEGEKIATNESGAIRASESFIPVIFSEDYDEILGYKAREPITFEEFQKKN